MTDLALIARFIRLILPDVALVLAIFALVGAAMKVL